jgi:3D (Asp-Asp-Asp) domain-containing protein
MRKVTRYAFAILAMASSSLGLTHEGSAQEVVSSYVTFYGLDDNDDGNPSHLQTDAISNASVHRSAETLATDKNFLAPGTRVYVPALERYYVMEDTCVECSKDWSRDKLHIDLYVSGTGPGLAACEDRLTMERTDIIIDPPSNLPVRAGSACGG